MKKLLCVVLAACYGILAVAATAPHSHETGATIRLDRGPQARVEVVDGRAREGRSGQSERLALCRLCAWSRSTARPVPATDIIEVEPPRLTARPIPEESRAEDPLSANALLRAPPRT
jgi:hypothetical protein